MAWAQLATPSPDIPCKPGWCLQYVRQAFGLPARHPTATAAWEASASQHTGTDFPPGVWLPVWYALANEPAGHVVLLAPDGSCYSTSDLSNTPHHHPDLEDLERYYARYGMTLTYRGWTEDVAGFPVITNTEKESTVTPEQWAFMYTWMANMSANVLTKKDLAAVAARLDPDIDEARLAAELLKNGSITIAPKP